MSVNRVRVVSVVEAKARFSEVVREAEAGAIVMIRRHGRDVAAVVPAKDAEHVGRLRAAGPEKGLAAVAGGWKGSEDLVEGVDAIRRSPARRRARLGS
jgi:prevent-host-death family protein